MKTWSYNTKLHDKNHHIKLDTKTLHCFFKNLRLL